MLIRKRDNTEENFSKYKIKTAIESANNSISPQDRIKLEEIEDITNIIYKEYLSDNQIKTVEYVQDLIEDELMKRDHFKLAKHYITYRYQHTEDRKYKSFLAKARTIANGTSKEMENDNANKPNQIVQCRRDYLAGLVCKELSSDMFDEDLLEAHKEGIIHIHDNDYNILPLHNCDLIDLDDMLQNGTVIGNTYISKPNSFRTACTVASQIVTSCSFSQYGGMSITLTHLAPFVDISRQNLIKRNEWLKEKLSEQDFNNFIEKELRKEIKDGVQTLQYQFITLSNASQSPFITVFMYLNEVSDDAKLLKADLAMLIEEVLKQRIQGVQCDDGHFVSPVFPKLIYVLQDNNVDENSPYFYLTKLAAECTARRMVPDYTSDKVMVAERYGIDINTGLVIKGKEEVFIKWMRNYGYSDEEILKEIEKELNEEVA